MQRHLSVWTNGTSAEKIGIISDLLPQQPEETIPKTSVELSFVDMEPKKPAKLAVADIEPKKPVELSVVDMEPKQAPALSVVDIPPKNPTAGLKVDGMDKPQTASSMICPKCKTQQELAVACAECGVILEKFRQIASTTPNHRSAALDETGHQTDDDEASGNKFMIVAGVGMALIILTSVAALLL